MKRIGFAATLVLFLTGVALCGEPETSVTYNPWTGDATLDATLGDLNLEADRDRDAFLSDLSTSYGIPRLKLDEMVVKGKMRLGDIFMAVKISKTAERPLDDVLEEYQSNRGKGWGVIARNLGIKPGSEAFHALKEDASATLDRTRERKKGKQQGKGKEKPREKDKGKGKKK
ncbi:MAG: hypothetical protein JW821_19920 [Deltaproteobacteria bacterium]|nr:hypothetical protein [Deltaproteobacteria bacterium]